MAREIMLGGDAAAPSRQTSRCRRPSPIPRSKSCPRRPNSKSSRSPSHVPAECLYVRFGSFTNYQWFRHRLDNWGGDLRNLISARGLNYNMNARLERQLSLHETPLSALLGPTVIADVALIGDDTFFREGAAIGMLFQARNNFALDSDFRRQRTETLVKEPRLHARKTSRSPATPSPSSRPPTIASARSMRSMAIFIS